MQRSLFVTLLLVTALGCSEPTAPAIDGSAPDAGVDGGPLAECALPTPMIGGTAETDAIANAPPRCGAPATAWLRSDRLGEVVLREPGTEYAPRTLSALVAGAGVTLPRDPEHRVRVETIAYVTQDRGALVQSSALVAYPIDLPERDELPVLLVLHGTSGFRPECGPTADSTTEALVALFASYGWIAVGPDYLGLESRGEPYGALHPYLVGEPTAIASLDAVRAASRMIASDRGALCPSTRVAVFGGSQGGHAALWIDRLAPYYARELSMIGVAATVPASDIVGQADRALSSVVPATSNFAAMLGTQAGWYGGEARLADIFASPYDVDVPAALAAGCDPGDTLDTPANLDALFTQTFLDAVAAGGVESVEEVGCWVREASLTVTSVPRIASSDPSYGILFVVGEDDSLIYPPIERAAYDTLCAQGMPLQYLECAGAEHVPTTLWSIPELLDFLDARNAGEAFTPECTRPAAARCRGTPAAM